MNERSGRPRPEKQSSRAMMNTREVAEYLRIKERKVYDLVRAKQIPCSRVTGKWLFPRALIDLWVAHNTEYGPAGAALRPAPRVVAGSHDPLLDWAVRESKCGMALLTGGSLDGLRRLAAGEAMVAGMHVLDPDSGEYNVPVAREALAGRDVVLIEWARREQGLLTAPGNPLGIGGVADLRAHNARVISRQHEAGSQILLIHLLAETGVDSADLRWLPQPSLSESDLALAVLEGKADAGLAVRAVAQQFRLHFVPLHSERFDLAMRRRDYFEAPVQSLLEFARGPAFAERAVELGGYDITRLGRVVWSS
ncbi:MAG TPA: helix-turn-helix transcriptional regulator [Alphaproteobacteria bacterium]|nr:helix-turn-helix transcriptional regulator [Alphaproteobacteria bacterium]